MRAVVVHDDRRRAAGEAHGVAGGSGINRGQGDDDGLDGFGMVVVPGSDDESGAALTGGNEQRTGGSRVIQVRHRRAAEGEVDGEGRVRGAGASDHERGGVHRTAGIRAFAGQGVGGDNRDDGRRREGVITNGDRGFAMLRINVIGRRGRRIDRDDDFRNVELGDHGFIAFHEIVQHPEDEHRHGILARRNDRLAGEALVIPAVRRGAAEAIEDVERIVRGPGAADGEDAGCHQTDGARLGGGRCGGTNAHDRHDGRFAVMNDHAGAVVHGIDAVMGRDAQRRRGQFAGHGFVVFDQLIVERNNLHFDARRVGGKFHHVGRRGVITARRGRAAIVNPYAQRVGDGTGAAEGEDARVNAGRGRWFGGFRNGGLEGDDRQAVADMDRHRGRHHSQPRRIDRARGEFMRAGRCSGPLELMVDRRAWLGLNDEENEGFANLGVGIEELDMRDGALEINGGGRDADGLARAEFHPVPRRGQFKAGRGQAVIAQEEARVRAGRVDVHEIAREAERRIGERRTWRELRLEDLDGLGDAVRVRHHLEFHALHARGNAHEPRQRRVIHSRRGRAAVVDEDGQRIVGRPRARDRETPAQRETPVRMGSLFCNRAGGLDAHHGNHRRFVVVNQHSRDGLQGIKTIPFHRPQRRIGQQARDHCFVALHAPVVGSLNKQFNCGHPRAEGDEVRPFRVIHAIAGGALVGQEHGKFPGQIAAVPADDEDAGRWRRGIADRRVAERLARFRDGRTKADDRNVRRVLSRP